MRLASLLLSPLLVGAFQGPSSATHQFSRRLHPSKKKGAKIAGTTSERYAPGGPFASIVSKSSLNAGPFVEDEESWTDFGKSPLTFGYAALWLGLLAFVFAAPGEFNSESDTALIQSIADNPVAPALMNPFFYAIFNLFVLIPVVLACTIGPRARKDAGIPWGPPVFVSTFIAFFVMGPYLALRKTPNNDTVFAEDQGWIISNIWENKLVNYASLAFGLLCLSTGVPGLDDVSGTWNDLLAFLSSSRFGAVSMADLTLVTLILTKEVADDYQIRVVDNDRALPAWLVGASTALLPILGTAVYCAARPPLPSRKKQ